jgi:hypothetical protein
MFLLIFDSEMRQPPELMPYPSTLANMVKDHIERLNEQEGDHRVVGVKYYPGGWAEIKISVPYGEKPYQIDTIAPVDEVRER